MYPYFTNGDYRRRSTKTDFMAPSVAFAERWFIMAKKEALIIANLIGFIGFLWNDINVLEELGYKVSFAANAEIIAGENHQEELNNRGIKFYPLNFSSKNPFAKENLHAYTAVKNLIKKGDYDVIHCHTPIAGFITRLAAKNVRKKGTKVIYTTHGFAFTHLSPKKQWIGYYNFEKIASLYTDVIITINHEDFKNAKTMLCKDVRIINGVGVDTNKYHNVNIDVDKYKQKNKIPRNKIIILSVGELSFRKNHQIIIKALGQLQNKEDYCYVICGREVDGSGVAEMLEKLAQECGIQLILLGHRADIPELIHCSDIGAIPSLREGLGLAGIQSLCAGVPLVGADVQGIKDYIVPGKTGFLCNPYDEFECRDAIVKLSDPQLRDSMKKDCYEMAKRFDVTVSHKQMREIYTSVLIGK